MGDPAKHPAHACRRRTRPSPPPNRGPASAAEKIKIIDTNGDGILTQDELSMAAMAMFEKMDTDQDSFLTKSEIKAGHEKYMRKPSK